MYRDGMCGIIQPDIHRVSLLGEDKSIIKVVASESTRIAKLFRVKRGKRE